VRRRTCRGSIISKATWKAAKYLLRSFFFRSPARQAIIARGHQTGTHGKNTPPVDGFRNGGREGYYEPWRRGPRSRKRSARSSALKAELRPHKGGGGVTGTGVTLATGLSREAGRYREYIDWGDNCVALRHTTTALWLWAPGLRGGGEREEIALQNRL